MLIHNNCAAVSGFDAGVLQAQALGGGLAAGGDHDVVPLQLLGGTLGVEVGYGHRVSTILNGLDTNSGTRSNILVSDDFAGHLGDVRIVAAEECRYTI